MIEEFHRLVRFLTRCTACGLVILTFKSPSFAFGNMPEADQLGLQAHLPSEAGDTSVNDNLDRMVAILFILGLSMAAVGIWSAVDRQRLVDNLFGDKKQKLRKARIDNLFLSFQFQTYLNDMPPQFGPSDKATLHAQVSSEQLGYLRSLALREATFVSPIKFKRGTHLLLKFGMLPGFPDNHYTV